MPCHAQPNDPKTPFFVDIPQKHAAILFGSTTAGWKQRVVAKVEDSTFTFTGVERKLLTVVGATDPTYTVTIPPAEHDRKIYLSFDALHPAKDNVPAGYKDSKVKFEEHTVPKYATYFTFYTEDGFDSDDHDTDFVVSVIPTFKVFK